MATLMDAYQSAVLGAQNIQEKQFEIDAYKKQLADQAEAEKTYAEAQKTQPTMVGGYQDQKGPPSLAQGILPGESGSMPTKSPLGGAPMPSFMGGAKAEEAAKQPVTPEAPATPMEKMKSSQNEVEGLQGVLQRNTNAIKLANAKGNYKMANALALQNEELQNKHDVAKIDHLKNVQTSLEIGGQLVRGYEAEVKANPADSEGAWARFVLKAQSELGATGDELMRARTPQERAAMVENLKGRAEKGTDIIKAEMAQARLAVSIAEAERKKLKDEKTALLGDQKEVDRQRSLKRLEIQQKQGAQLPLSEEDVAFLQSDIGMKLTPAATTPAATTEVSTGTTLTNFAGKIKTLEGSRADQVSAKGAEGTMQVMPGTKKDPGFGVTPAKDNSPAELERVGTDYANALLTNYNGNEAIAAAAYNWGPKNVDASIAKAKKNGTLPEEQIYKDAPQETKAYLDRLNSTLPNAKPAQPTVAGAPIKAGEPLRPKMSSADIMRSQRTINAGNSTISVLETIKEMPIGTSMGALPNLTTKDGMTAAIRNYAGRAITSDSEDQLNTVFKGLGRDLAAVETGGLATGLTDLSKSLESGLGINPGQATPDKVAMKLADVKRIVIEHLQPQIDSKTLTPAQTESAKQIIAKIDNIIPYSTTDVAIATRKAQSGGKQTTGAAAEAAVKGKPDTAHPTDIQDILNKYKPKG